MSPSRTIALCNLGCSKNLVDGERMLKFLAESGYEIVEDYALADIIIVNTCAFIREAREEAIESVLEMAEFKKTGRCSTLAVSGCFSQRHAHEARRKLPEVDHWISLDNWEKDVRSIFSAAAAISFRRHLSEPIATQYLKIAEGCNHGCSFCVIPAIRGVYKSREIRDIVHEARWLYEQGTRELIVVSQDTSWYGKDRGTTLTHLLETLLKETDFPWIRMMYLHPAYVDDDLLRLVGQEKRLCSYFDIPLQHSADDILRAMKRRPLSAGNRALIERIRSLVPDAAIRTSFIVGFPGETEAHFQELLDFIEWARFDKVGVFPFSPEEGTEAVALRPRPRSSTANSRVEMLMEAQQAISRSILQSRKGTKVDFIIDRISESPDFNFEGRTQWDAPEVDGRVMVVEGNCEVGSIYSGHIIDTSDYDLYAVVR